MKITKLVMGIVSVVLIFLVMFQSCAAGLGEAIVDIGGTSGGAGDVECRCRCDCD